MTDWKSLPQPDDRLAPAVCAWYERHGRDFPWRSVTDPFRVLCTEIMLQRTRAMQVARVFKTHVKHWSGPADVLELGTEGVDALFGQLGLVWRAEYFWRLQEVLAEEFDGHVPDSWNELRALPGVGEYVAAAVLVFSFGESRTVVDANVLRILGRYYEIDFPDHARRSGRVLSWAGAHAPEGAEKVRWFNWGMLDLGGMVCTPGDPDHQSCPLLTCCVTAPGAG